MDKSHKPHPIRSVRGAVAGLCLSMMLSSLGTSIANVALPTMARELSATFQEVQWVVLAFLVAVTTLSVSAGRLGDLTGRRRLLLAGIFVFTAASVICGIAPTLWLLIGARAVQGAGAAVMMALTMAFVGETVAKDKIGSAMGLLGTMSAVGTLLGPSLGGGLITWLGWRAVFLVNVPLGIIAFALASRYLPADQQPKASRVRFDHAGTLVLALTLAAYALSMTLGRRFGPFNVVLLVAALVGIGLFVLVESKAESPLMGLAEFRNPVLRTSLAMNALVSTVMMATLVVGPFYLSSGLGLNVAAVGMVMAVGPLISTLGGVPSGRLVDRLGGPRMVITGLLGMAAGSLALSVLPTIFGVGGYMAAIAVLTPGYQLFQSANNTVVMTGVSPDRRGVTSGMLNLSRNVGLVTGASVMGAVFAYVSAGAKTTPAAADATGMRITFGVAALLIAAAFFLACVSRSAKRRVENMR